MRRRILLALGLAATIGLLSVASAPAQVEYVEHQPHGRPQNQIWFRHADVLGGSTIRLEMSNTPNTSLGTNPAEFPPSSLALDPATLVK